MVHTGLLSHRHGLSHKIEHAQNTKTWSQLVQQNSVLCSCQASDWPFSMVKLSFFSTRTSIDTWLPTPCLGGTRILSGFQLSQVFCCVESARSCVKRVVRLSHTICYLIVLQFAWLSTPDIRLLQSESLCISSRMSHSGALM